MKVNTALFFTLSLFLVGACTKETSQPPLVGTWELISATTIEKDTTFSTFDPKRKMIKIINPTHFAFLNHALKTEKDSSASFTAGGGNYTLADSSYTEHLEYYVDKQWENNTFHFVIKLNGDTLIQKGVEKVDKLGIDRIIIEKYVRVKK